MLLPLIAINVFDVTDTVLSLRFVFLHRGSKSVALGPCLDSMVLPWRNAVQCALPNSIKILRSRVSDSTVQDVMDYNLIRDICL